MNDKANTRQVGGDHYASGFQHWDLVRMALGNRYLEGNVTKYVARYPKKGGSQDLRKALHYLDKMIELHAAGEYRETYIARPIDLDKIIDSFCTANDVGLTAKGIIETCACWSSGADLDIARGHLVTLIAEQDAAEAQRQAVKAGAVDTTREQGAREDGEPGRAYLAPDDDRR